MATRGWGRLLIAATPAPGWPAPTGLQGATESERDQDYPGFFPRSGYRDCTHDYTQDGAVPLRRYCPAQVSSRRLVELMPRALVPVCSSLYPAKAAAPVSPLSIPTPMWMRNISWNR